MDEAGRRRLRINRTVVTLGVVSLLTDISSEGIYPLIPIFLTGLPGTNAAIIGLIEGIAESTASLLRVFSGWMSDRMQNRKWFAAAGYGLSALSKPFLAAATVWHHVLVVRFADRLGKGIRSAPRDALIADVTPPESRGISFGFHRAMDTTGAVAGPLLAFWLLKSLNVPLRTIFLLSAIPAILAVLILVSMVREPKHEKKQKSESIKIQWGSLGRPFKMFLLVTTVFALGNSSDAFLILRAKDLGISTTSILLVYVLFNSVEAVTATFAGHVSDCMGRKKVIFLGYLVFAAVYAGFGLATNPSHIWALFAFYGIYQAATQGVQKAFASDMLSKHMRGSGLGAYHTLTGVALLPASIVAGLLWDNVNPSAPFFYGAAAAVISAVMLALLIRGQTTCSDT